MVSRRAREWSNESGLLTPAASTQVSFTLASAVSGKGVTVIRVLMDVAISPVTLNVDAILDLALWFGPSAGAPSNIGTDNTHGFMMWTRMVHRKTSGEGQAWLLTKSFDLRGQRASRSDLDVLNFLVRPGSASAVNVYFSSRVLSLLP